MTYELTPKYDSRKSFYGKAKVVETKCAAYNRKVLYSYETRAAVIDVTTNTATVYNTQSATTLRHVKEFLKQDGFKADTLAQILRDYGEGK